LMSPLRATAKLLLAHFEQPIMALYQRSAFAKRLMRTAEAMIKKTPTMAEVGFLSRAASFSTTKANERIGYLPNIPMAGGIELSVAWLRHHGYIRDGFEESGDFATEQPES